MGTLIRITRTKSFAAISFMQDLLKDKEVILCKVLKGSAERVP